jgi:hypothetical protein
MTLPLVSAGFQADRGLAVQRPALDTLSGLVQRPP